MTANSVSSVVPAVQSTGLGVPLSYQRTATQTNLNTPPWQSAVAIQKRPTFTTTKKGLETRQKSLIWWTCRRLAKLEKRSRCTLSLTEETSSVDEVFAFRRITSNPNCCFSTHCTSSTDEVSSVSDMYTVPWTFARRQHIHHYKRFLPRHLTLLGDGEGWSF